MNRKIRTWVEISLNDLEHNYREISSRLPDGCQMLGVCKANAYGHGLENAVEAFADADGFATIDLCDAERARRAGWHKRVLLLEGFFDETDIEPLQDLDVETVVHSMWQIDILKRLQLRVGMYEYREHAPHLLSGGQKQRVAIAGIIALEPKCIVLDEPTAMLDPRGRADVMQTVEKLNREKGITVVLITHHMDEAAQAQRVIVLDKGKVAADGTPKQVFAQVEMLHKLGLAAPDSVELCWALRQKGFDLPLDALTPEECAQALYDWLKA